MNLQRRMKLLERLNNDLRDTMTEWCRGVEFEEDSYRLVWQDDGTCAVETQYHEPVLRFQVEITTSVVGTPEAPNKPKELNHRLMKWGHIPAGWFVLSPTKIPVWYEVTKTEMKDHRQAVTLRFPDGTEHTFDRPRLAEVTACPGTRWEETTDAMEALGSVFRTDIIGDQIS